MKLDDFLSEIRKLSSDAEQSFAAVDSPSKLEEARVEYLGAKNGRIKSVQKLMGELAAEDRPTGGKHFNEVRLLLQRLLDNATERIANSTVRVETGPQFDPTLPGIPTNFGHLHPVTQTMEHLKEIMGRLGFSVLEGPEVEDEWHNFDALNIPADHPARDPLDNFYIEVATKQSASPLLLRSQTSTVQIRAMEASKPPLRIISLGRVYRPDEADATHFPMFHQMEGLWVDRDVTMAQLKSVLRLFATNYLGADVQVQFRPSFFPFTEPSVEVDFRWNDRWVEFGGAGMVDPNVLRAVGYDPEEVSGFAFGLGVERLCMRRFGITDIRDLYRNDVRFLRQF